MTKSHVQSIEFPDAPESSASGDSLVAKDMSLVGHIPVSLTALVGSVSISIEQLFALKKGEVLSMNEALDAPITLQLNGKSVAKGELVAVDDHFGIRITELS